MGNICGKESSAFAQPGRVLGTTPVQPTSAPIPKKVVGGPPRRLGTNTSSSATTPESQEDARRKAAQAAEARAQQAKGGDLTKKLTDQKKLTHRATLEAHAKQNLREREVDAGNEALRHG
ncbi:hypothetical protein QBC47DRAFT_376601 [Echria macrotheca]|uniref:Uncharacterized protein n=1 Tax=Echria macrotheca TaxID=438768 RepID=A0AAJ0BGT2_9PEZI|nr:hypothetical protein QBC47DRAFT_376601 [Echria macrotheca]